MTYREKQRNKRKPYKTFETHYFNKRLQQKAIEKMADLANHAFLPLGTELFQYKVNNGIVGLTIAEWRRMNEILDILKEL